MTSGPTTGVRSLDASPPEPHGAAHIMPTRLHMALEDNLVEETHRRTSSQPESPPIDEPTPNRSEDDRRWNDIEAALGRLPDTGHEWDDDPAAWVRRQRRVDRRSRLHHEEDS